MYWLKACPRCRGDLHEERDTYGAYVVCIQCGCILTTDQESMLRATGSLMWEVVQPVVRAA